MSPTTKPQTTITLSQEVKDVLAQAKGDRSWDEFLGDVALRYADEAIALAERRLRDLRRHKVRGVTLAELAKMRGAKKGAVKARGKPVEPPRPSRGRRRAA